MLDKAHRPEESLSVIGLALESNEKLNNRLRFVQCSLVKAQVYMGLDNPDAAIKIYEELENSGSLNDFPDQRYGFLLLLATHYMDIASSNKELEHALSLAEEAIKIEEKYGVGTADSHLIKAKVNKKLGRWEQHATSIELYIEKYQTQLNLDVSSRAKQFDQQRELENAERDRQVNLARFQEQEKILHNMLPASIANRMMEGEKTIADDFRHASIFFSDIVGFTEMSASVNSSTLVNLLNDIFREFDRIADKYQIEKIKTIGDAYMAVAGVPVADPGHAKNIAQFALEVSESMKHFTLNEKPVQLRIGLHTGEVVAGVIGERKFAFDLWGDSVNVAFRMESSGEPGTIHVSEAFKNAINEASFCFEERGEVHVKGKGNMKTFFLSKA
jgi:class 3 adenylate cyclase